MSIIYLIAGERAQPTPEAGTGKMKLSIGQLYFVTSHDADDGNLISAFINVPVNIKDNGDLELDYGRGILVHGDSTMLSGRRIKVYLQTKRLTPRIIEKMDVERYAETHFMQERSEFLHC